MVRTKDGGIGPAPQPHRRSDNNWDCHLYLSSKAERAAQDILYARRIANPPIKQNIHDFVDEAILREAGGGLNADDYNAINAAQAKLAAAGIAVMRVDIVRACLWYALDHLTAQALAGDPVFHQEQKEA